MTKWLPAGLAGLIVILGAVYLLLPSTYAMSGRVLDDAGQGVKGVAIKSSGNEATSDNSGHYQLKRLKKGDPVTISVPESYDAPKLNVNYQNAKSAGLKAYGINQDIKISLSPFGFATQLFNDQKYQRYNLIWNLLDDPSKKIYGDLSSYEKFFTAYSNYQNTQAMKDFKINKGNITLRESWASPQGTVYKDVYEVPVEETLNNGTGHSETEHIFKVSGTWRVTTALKDQKEYQDTKDALQAAGAL